MSPVSSGWEKRGRQRRERMKTGEAGPQTNISFLMAHSSPEDLCLNDCNSPHSSCLAEPIHHCFAQASFFLLLCFFYHPESQTKSEKNRFCLFLTRRLKVLNYILQSLQIEIPNKTATFLFSLPLSLSQEPVSLK